MLEIKQTATYSKWENNLKDKRAKAARIFRLANGLAGKVKSVGNGISEIRIFMDQGIGCTSNGGGMR